MYEEFQQKMDQEIVNQIGGLTLQTIAQKLQIEALTGQVQEAQGKVKELLAKYEPPAVPESTAPNPIVPPDAAAQPSAGPTAPAVPSMTHSPEAS